jgi:hypothetical protein
MYDQHLAYWRSHFPPESFCVLSFEFFERHTAEALAVVSRFLGVGELDWSQKIGQASNFTFVNVRLSCSSDCRSCIS